MAEDILLALASALQKFAVWLNDLLGFPWPLTLMVLFPVFVGLLGLTVWWLRGSALPVSCDYQTVRKRACRRPAVGEWHRCWQHRYSWQRRTDRHTVNPRKIRRWEVMRGDKIVERDDVHGAGLFSARSDRTTLLYHRGFATPPWDVIKDVPKKAGETRRRILETMNEIRLRAVSLRHIFGRRRTLPETSGVSPFIPEIVSASRMIVVLVLIGLTLVLVALFAPEPARQYVEYSAAGLFIYAWAIAHLALWKKDSGWRRGAASEALKWAGEFLVFSIVLGGIIQIGG